MNASTIESIEIASNITSSAFKNPVPRAAGYTLIRCTFLSIKMCAFANAGELSRTKIYDWKQPCKRNQQTRIYCLDKAIEMLSSLMKFSVEE